MSAPQTILQNLRLTASCFLGMKIFLLLATCEYVGKQGTADSVVYTHACMHIVYAHAAVHMYAHTYPHAYARAYMYMSKHMSIRMLLCTYRYANV